MRLAPDLVRLGIIFAVIGGMPVLLALLLSQIGGDATPSGLRGIGEIVDPGIGEVSVVGAQSIDHEPISLERAYELIESGQVYMIALRARQADLGEFCYFPLTEDESPCTWRVVGEDVHLFTETMPTGVPILSDDGVSVGVTSTQLENLLERVEIYNARASSPIDVLDQRIESND